MGFQTVGRAQTKAPKHDAAPTKADVTEENHHTSAKPQNRRAKDSANKAGSNRGAGKPTNGKRNARSKQTHSRASKPGGLVVTMNENPTSANPGGYPYPTRPEGSKRYSHENAARNLIEKFNGHMLDEVPYVQICGKWRVLDSNLSRDLLVKMDLGSTKSGRAEAVETFCALAHEGKRAPWYHVQLKNGVYNLKTGEFKGESDPAYIYTNPIPYAYNPNATSRIMEAFLKDLTCNHRPTIQNLKEITGLLLSGYTGDFNRILYLYGKGQNGKSTLISTWQTMLGEANYSNEGIHEFGKRFRGIDTVGKLGNFGDDMPSNAIPNESCAFMKAATSGNHVTIEQKGVNPLSFSPYLNFIFAGNEIPRFRDRSYGLERRLLLLSLPNTFTADSPNYDHKFADKLQKEPHIQALIKTGLEAFSAVIKRNGYTPNPKADNLLAMSLGKDATVKNYIESLKRDASFKAIDGMPCADLYDDYETWCAGEELAPVSIHLFGQTLGKLEGVKSKTVRLDQEKTAKVYELPKY